MFTGGGDNVVSEVDPVALKVINHVDVGGSVDAIAYDPSNGRIYADEDDGARVWVIDAKTFKVVKTIAIPGHKPEYLAINPKTHEVYQNIDSESEIAVIDPKTMTVSRTIPTPEIKHNHPLQYDPDYDQIVIAGGGVMSAYAPSGKKIGETAVGRFDQCDLDPTQHVLACAGDGGITRYRLQRNGAPQLLDKTAVDAGVHTTAIDSKTHAVFAVWGDRDGKATSCRSSLRRRRAAHSDSGHRVERGARDEHVRREHQERFEQRGGRVHGGHGDRAVDRTDEQVRIVVVRDRMPQIVVA